MCYTFKACSARRETEREAAGAVYRIICYLVSHIGRSARLACGACVTCAREAERARFRPSETGYRERCSPVWNDVDRLATPRGRIASVTSALIIAFAGSESTTTARRATRFARRSAVTASSGAAPACTFRIAAAEAGAGRRRPRDLASTSAKRVWQRLLTLAAPRWARPSAGGHLLVGRAWLPHGLAHIRDAARQRDGAAGRFSGNRGSRDVDAERRRTHDPRPFRWCSLWRRGGRRCGAVLRCG